MVKSDIEKDMLDSLGVNSVEDLFSDIPEELKLKRELTPRLSNISLSSCSVREI